MTGSCICKNELELFNPNCKFYLLNWYVVLSDQLIHLRIMYLDWQNDLWNGKTAKVYFEFIRTSTMQLFCDNSYQLLAVNYFCKKNPSQMFEWILNMSLDYSRLKDVSEKNHQQKTFILEWNGYSGSYLFKDKTFWNTINLQYYSLSIILLTKNSWRFLSSHHWIFL